MPMTPVPRGPGDDVRLEPRAVVDVDDGHLLAGQQIGRLHEVLVDGDGAHVVEIGLGDRGPVNLRLQHGAEHGVSPLALRG